jgi:hypothetical protein
MNRKELVLTALNRLLKESLHKDQSKRPSVSICNYSVAGGLPVSCRWECAKSWKHFSGDVVYPVPCPNGRDGAFYGGSAYYAYRNSEDNGGAFWVGKYGNSRRAYLRHMIQWVQENLDESE